MVKSLSVNGKVVYIGEFSDGLVIPINRNLSLRKSGADYEIIKHIHGVADDKATIVEFWYKEYRDGEKIPFLRDAGYVIYRGNLEETSLYFKNKYKIEVNKTKYFEWKGGKANEIKITDKNGNEITKAYFRKYGIVIPINEELRIRITAPKVYDLIYLPNDKSPDYIYLPPEYINSSDNESIDGFIIDVNVDFPHSMAIIKRCHSVKELNIALGVIGK